MKIGYVRVSVNEPTSDPQLKALRNAGVRTKAIYTDRVSGTKSEWRYLTVALSRLKAGDTFIVWRLDRLGRSLKHLKETITALIEQGIVFKSLTENIDTATPAGLLIIHYFSVLAEFERHHNKEQTIVGLQQAKLQGKALGQPRTNPKSEKVLRAKKLFLGKTPIPEILKTLNISRATLHRYVNLGSGNTKT